MNFAELQKKADSTFHHWIEEAGKYSHEHFTLQPNEESWSVGQVYQHLIITSHRIFSLIEKCLTGNQNEHEQKTERGEQAMATDILSETKVKVPASIQPFPPQPESIERVKQEIETIKHTFSDVLKKVENSVSTGKEKHGVLGFLNATEWLRAIEMHFKHHQKQVKEINEFLEVKK